jgi:pimeloyl-ACP methyl ester carboxylesterase
MISQLYTSQLEELASHGYVVAAVTHSYDGFLTVFPDGSYIAYDGKRWPQIPSVEGESNLDQLEWHADDIRVVLDELSRAPSTLPFSGRLDLAHVGAFGHSFGGIAAVHACQKDPRIKACLNQDGAVAMQPYFPDARGWGMDQPFMLIERAQRMEPPSDQELARMKLTRERVNEIRKRLDGNRDRVLRATGKGAYCVVLQRSVTTHMDFTDLQILGAAPSDEYATRERIMSVVRDYTRAFFDRYLKGMKSPLLDARVPNQFVESVERFGPGKRSR